MLVLERLDRLATPPQSIKAVKREIPTLDEYLCFFRGAEYMAFLIAYIDDSGTHEQSPITFAGGAIASKEQWIALESRWNEILEKYQITEFHSTDCESGQKCFKSWSREKRDEITFEFSDAIKDNIQLILGYGAPKSPFDKVLDEFKLKHTRYQLCAEICLLQISDWSKTHETEPVAVVFEAGQRYDRFLMDWYKSELTPSQLRDVFNIYSIDDKPKSELTLLQIADFIVYETFLFHKRFRFENKRQLRRSCRNLYANVQEKGIIFDEGLIRDLLLRIEQTKSEISEIKNRRRQ